MKFLYIFFITIVQCEDSLMDQVKNQIDYNIVEINSNQSSSKFFIIILIIFPIIIVFCLALENMFKKKSNTLPIIITDPLVILNIQEDIKKNLNNNTFKDLSYFLYNQIIFNDLWSLYYLYSEVKIDNIVETEDNNTINNKPADSINSKNNNTINKNEVANSINPKNIEEWKFFVPIYNSLQEDNNLNKNFLGNFLQYIFKKNNKDIDLIYKEEINIVETYGENSNNIQIINYINWVKMFLNNQENKSSNNLINNDNFIKISNFIKKNFYAIQYIKSTFNLTSEMDINEYDNNFKQIYLEVIQNFIFIIKNYWNEMDKNNILEKYKENNKIVNQIKDFCFSTENEENYKNILIKKQLTSQLLAIDNWINNMYFSKDIDNTLINHKNIEVIYKELIILNNN